MELLRKMLEVTMTRGAQSAGLVTYRQDGGDAQGCRARTVSGKRTDLARLVLSKFSRVIERRRPLLGAGLIAAPQLFQGHTRFATSSIADLGGCHPHQWLPASTELYWRFNPATETYHGEFTRSEAYITHNGAPNDCAERLSATVILAHGRISCPRCFPVVRRRSRLL